MTIKQQGGIFGRNPNFNEIEAGSLEVGSIDASSPITVSSSTPSIFLMETDTTDLNTRLRNSGGSLQIHTVNDSKGSLDARFRINHSTGEVTVYDNLVINTSGKGIDFSATSGTGTSELFDDYEEGTWTPTLTGYGGTPTVTGIYTKIGDTVFLDLEITLDGTSDASNYVIDSLPFSVSASGLGGAAVIVNSGGSADVLVTLDSSTRLKLRNSSDSNLTYNGIGSSSTIRLQARYKAA
jgi:hypothetical protein